MEVFLVGLAPYLLTVLIAMTLALVAAIYKSYQLVGRGRWAIWTFVLAGLLLAVFHALAELRYVSALWIPGTIFFSWAVLVPMSRFIGNHRRPD